MPPEPATSVVLQPPEKDYVAIRNKVLGFLLLFATIMTPIGWITRFFGDIGNVYELAFDILQYPLQIYFTYKLLKTKTIPKHFIAYMVASWVVSLFTHVLAKEWPIVIRQEIPSIFYLAYTVYYALGGVNRRKHRFANYVLLPAVFIIGYSAGAFFNHLEMKMTEAVTTSTNQIWSKSLQINKLYASFQLKDKLEWNDTYKKMADLVDDRARLIDASQALLDAQNAAVYISDVKKKGIQSDKRIIDKVEEINDVFKDYAAFGSEMDFKDISQDDADTLAHYEVEISTLSQEMIDLVSGSPQLEGTTEDGSSTEPLDEAEPGESPLPIQEPVI